MACWFGRKQFPLERIGFHAAAERLNCVDKLIDLFETPVHGGISQVRDLVDFAQLLQDFRADSGRRNFPAAGLELMHNFIHRFLERDEAD